MSKTPTVGQRTLLVRNALVGSNGQALLDFLMDEYVYNERGSIDPYKLAREAAERDLVLRLRRMALGD